MDLIHLGQLNKTIIVFIEIKIVLIMIAILELMLACLYGEVMEQQLLKRDQ